MPILAGGRLIGVLNLQHCRPYAHPPTEIKLVSTIGHLVGAEVERVRLDCEVTKLTGQLETRKLLARGQGNPTARSWPDRRAVLPQAATGEPQATDTYEAGRRSGSAVG